MIELYLNPCSQYEKRTAHTGRYRLGEARTESYEVGAARAKRIVGSFEAELKTTLQKNPKRRFRVCE
jgi:hypothetical protein